MLKRLTALTIAMVAFVAGRAEAKRPNIVFILADDLGYSDLGCYGHPTIRTPAIDALAARGVKFTQAYTSAPVCTPSRVALITGRYSQRLPIGLEEPLVAKLDVGLPPEHPTLPSLLKKAGYRTELIGKWHLGFLPKYGPRQSGYERFYGFRAGATDYFARGEDFWIDDERASPSGYLTDLLGRRAVESIAAYAKSPEPFFISLHFNAPHWPWEGPNDEAESKRVLHPEGPGLQHWDGGSVEVYQQMVEAMDRQVGRVMDALKSHGLAENTIVVFTSDHGGERFSNNWPLSGLKTEVLEGGLRVPSIIAWPAAIKAARRTTQVAAMFDWLPTLLAAAGTSPDPQFPSDGLNLLPHLVENAAPVPRTLFWRYRANSQEAARDGDMKYVRIRENTFLFDVVADPRERANRKKLDPDTYDRLRRLWDDWHTTMLPLNEAARSYALDGEKLADHVGTPPASGSKK